MEGELFNPFDDEFRPADAERKALPERTRAYLQRLEAYIAALRNSPLTPVMLAKAYWEITRRLEKAECGRNSGNPWEHLPAVSKTRLETVFGLMMDRLNAVAKGAVVPFADALRPPGYEEIRGALLAALASDERRALLPAALEAQVPRTVEPNSVAGVLVEFFAFVIDRELCERYKGIHARIFAEKEPPADGKPV